MKLSLYYLMDTDCIQTIIYRYLLYKITVHCGQQSLIVSLWSFWWCQLPPTTAPRRWWEEELTEWYGHVLVLLPIHYPSASDTRSMHWCLQNRVEVKYIHTLLIEESLTWWCIRYWEQQFNNDVESQPCFHWQVTFNTKYSKEGAIEHEIPMHMCRWPSSCH